MYNKCDYFFILNHNLNLNTLKDVFKILLLSLDFTRVAEYLLIFMISSTKHLIIQLFLNTNICFQSENSVRNLMKS